VVKEPTNDDATRNLSIVLLRLGDADAAAGDGPEAKAAFDESVDLARKRSEQLGQNSDSLSLIAGSLKAAGDGELALGQVSEALRNYSAGTDIARRLAMGPGRTDYVNTLVDMLGGYAFAKLQNREYSDALALSDEATALAPDQLWLLSNKAHALMFLGRSEQARKIYIEHVGEAVSGGEKWERTILDDFATFKKLGMNNPEMKIISSESIEYSNAKNIK
jgi:tetratricopeptide (TPR) repeat protein